MVKHMSRLFWGIIILVIGSYFLGVFEPSKKNSDPNSPVQKGVEISMTCGGKGKQYEECAKTVRGWEEKTGNRVNLVSIPSDANERLALYQQFLAAKSKNIDVFMIDVTHPALLGYHFEDLSPVISDEDKKQHFTHLVENNTIDGKLLAMPFYTEVGVLYYRSDLLEKYGLKAPETWEDLEAGSLKVIEEERKAGQEKIWGFVFQGKAYEGLTVNGIEWIDSFNGKGLLDDKGIPLMNSPEALGAFKMASRWIGKISPEGVLNYNEEDCRGVFQSGNAVFLRSWGYVWSLLNTEDSVVNKKVKIAKLPKGGANGKHTGALGGWQVAVSKYSEHKKEAMDLVKYITKKQEQKNRAISSGYLPTIPELYKDADIIQAHPHFAQIEPLFEAAIVRPSKKMGLKYSQFSKELFMGLHAILSSGENYEDAAKTLQKRLEEVMSAPSR